MDREKAIQLADNYRKTMRQIKEAGLTIVDMPPDVAEAVLALHQHALAVEDMKRRERKQR